MTDDLTIHTSEQPEKWTCGLESPCCKSAALLQAKLEGQPSTTGLEQMEEKLVVLMQTLKLSSHP